MTRSDARDVLVCKVNTIPALTALVGKYIQDIQTSVMIRDS